MTYQANLQPVFSALSDPTRRGIFDALANGPHSVSALAKARPISRPAVSQHLKVLEEAGLVSAVNKGTKRIYTIERAGLYGLRTYLEAFWDDVLDAYANEIDNNASNNQSGKDT